MALSQAEKEAKLVEIAEKEIEIEGFDAVTQVGVDAIRTEYNFAGMNEEINTYTASRSSDKTTLANELKALKDELVAE